MKPIGRLSKFLLLTIAMMAAFTTLQIVKGLSPQETISKSIHALLPHHDPRPLIQGFPEGNRGVIRALRESKTTDNGITAEQLSGVFGVHWTSHTPRPPVIPRFLRLGEKDGITYREGVFDGYDGVEIPFYEIQPPGFDSTFRYPTIVLYSGHGNMDQVAFDRSSYQKGAGLDLARGGFLVFTMENRGMGKLSYLGDHLRIDAVARLTGGSWHGEITTDALTLLDVVFQRPYVAEQRVGVAGISAGGSLSLMTAALDGRIAASYVQGHLGSYRTTYGTRGTHDICSNIYGILNHFDMKDIAILAFPTPFLFVNGQEDSFDYRDATDAFQYIKQRYRDGNVADRVSLLTPAGLGHEFSTDIAMAFFRDVLLQ